jgi:hypothetical protein
MKVGVKNRFRGIQVSDNHGQRPCQRDYNLDLVKTFRVHLRHDNLSAGTGYGGHITQVGSELFSRRGKT